MPLTDEPMVAYFGFAPFAKAAKVSRSFDRVSNEESIVVLGLTIMSI